MTAEAAVDVRVRLFASLRDQLGSAGQQVSVPAPADLSALLEALIVTLAGPLEPAAIRALLTGSNVRIAVNQRLVEGNMPLASGDEVAFLPPVTGG